MLGRVIILIFQNIIKDIVFLRSYLMTWTLCSGVFDPTNLDWLILVKLNLLSPNSNNLGRHRGNKIKTYFVYFIRCFRLLTPMSGARWGYLKSLQGLVLHFLVLNYQNVHFMIESDLKLKSSMWDLSKNSVLHDYKLEETKILVISILFKILF